MSTIHLETEEIPIERWKRAEIEQRSTLRALPQDIDLEAVFSLHFPRTVYNDGTIKFQEKSYRFNQVPGKKVFVAFQPGRKIMALFNNEKIWQYYLERYR